MLPLQDEDATKNRRGQEIETATAKLLPVRNHISLKSASLRSRLSMATLDHRRNHLRRPAYLQYGKLDTVDNSRASRFLLERDCECGRWLTNGMKQLAHHKRIYPLGEMENYDAEEPATETEDVFGGLVEEEVRLNGLDEKNNDFLIIPPRVLGYSTKEKLWGQFGIVSILPPEGKQPHKFRENLQLDDKYKELIEALVESHEANGNNGRRAVQDMVNDKGKAWYSYYTVCGLTRGAGLLFLLVLTHYSPVGPPGVWGKR